MSAMNIIKISSSLSSLIRPVSLRKVHQLSRASYAQTLLNLPETKVTVLDNGLKVASEYSDAGPATVGLWIDAGSRFESPDKNGIGHFFEQMAFKGTTQRSEKDLATEIENLGAQFSSYTDREETAFYARCRPSDVAKIVDILADIIKNPRLDSQQVEDQRTVVLNKLKEADSNFRLVTMDYLHATAYQGTPLGQSVLGPSRNIRHITKEDLAYFVRNNFLAPRIALVGTGDIKHDELVKLAEKHLSSLPYTYEGEIPVVRHCRFTGSEVRDRDDWVPFAHIAIAFDTCGHGSPDIYPLMLAKTIVGNWDKTFSVGDHTVHRLIRNIHKEPGCHSFESFHLTYRDTGLWGIHFVMTGLLIDEFVDNLTHEWMRICNSATESDLEIAKSMLRTNLLNELDGPTRTAADIGRQVLHYGERRPIADMEDQIQSVTLQTLKDISSKYIYNRCPAVAAVGPIEAMTDYNRLRSNLYWLRV